MNLDKLRGKITENRMSQAKLAEELGLSSKALNEKLTGKSRITIPEAALMIKILKIEHPCEIFFD
ncbi:helix-turn-helix transcriptional regulator [Sebaldella sp. S0638]|uniref:helix-turn-helix domain-containing protein n=1 Tax=Sebaldella sp. S0638 TaxID=2957809 RepID=UPI0020A212B2|nr:helix-turn-helix transcriptional regulator [Sebaldella sp. S0638]MCP1226001.1 helix-turn-helix domain-containing protein [Sebaldella sp. S0638]